MVPRTEAWRSGATLWSEELRRSFANDLGLAATLAAVTNNVNQSKGDKDPASWMPPLPQMHCEYATEWLKVEWRWNLPVDQDDVNGLIAILQRSCGKRVSVTEVNADSKQGCDGGIRVPIRGAAAVLSTTRVTVPRRAPEYQFHAPIAWLASEDISTNSDAGNGCRTFAPLQSVNRDAMAAFLYQPEIGGATPSLPAPARRLPAASMGRAAAALPPTRVILSTAVLLRPG